MALPKLLDLTEEREHARRSGKDIVDRADKEGRPMTAEEVTAFDAYKDQVINLDKRIVEVKDTMDRRQQADKMLEDSRNPTGRQVKPDPNPDPNNPNPAQVRIPASMKRTGALKAFKGVDAEQNAYRSGMWARAAILQDERASRWCHNHGVFNALATNDNNLGGVLVPEELSQAIIDLREVFGVFRQNVDVVPMGSDTMLIPRRAGGVTANFVGENATITDSDPTWNQVRLVAKKLAGMTRMSVEIDEDAVINLADWLAREFAYAFAIKEDACGFNGDGTSLYGGIRGLTYLLNGASGLAGAVDAATAGHDTYAEIDANDLATLMVALPAYARPGAKWYVSTVGFDMIFGRLLQAAGGNTIGDIEKGYTPRYLGYPVVLTQSLSTSVGNLNDQVMVLFGNLQMSTTMGDRRGIRVMPSEHRYFELDQIAVKATERFDIVNHDVGDANTAGPVVALVGKS